MKCKLPLFGAVMLFSVMTCLQFSPFIAHAQDNLSTVRGIVTGNNDEPLPGASVIIRNTKTNFTTGAKADSVGVFVVRVPAGGTYSFTFTNLGYESQTLSGYNLKGGTTFSLDITLKIAVAANLDQVVVVGYGTQKKATVTSSIVSVSAEEIRSRPVANALQAIQGKAAGVDVTSSERPGTVGGIRIRGERSVNGSNEPLYVVDGIPLNFGGIEAINPNDIETIDILKDASATAIYGSRGANGVVLVTTKRGKSGALSISYVGTMTLEKLYDRFKRMNAPDYIEFRRNAYRRIRYLNPATTAPNYPDQPTLVDDRRIFGQDPIAFANIEKGWVNGVWQPELVPTTNWTDYALQNGVTQDHTISVSGGTQNVKAYGSFGYLNNTGTQRGQDYKRYSGKISVDLTPAKWFSMGGSVNATFGYQNYGFSTTSATGPGSIYSALQTMLPYAVPYDSTGNRIILPGGDINIVNPVDENDYNINLRKTVRILGSIYAEAKILKGLKYRVNFGPDFQSYYNGRWMDSYSINRGGGTSGSTNYAQLNQTNNFSWTLDNLIYYDKTIRGNHTHDIGATLLQSALYRRSETSTMTASKLPLQNQKWYGLGNVSALDAFGTGLTESALTSYMARVNYAFDQKYLLTAFVRWDGASVLAAGHKWDMFPSISVGWRMDKERFLQKVTWIDRLKLRVGIGTVGNAAVDPYTTLGGLQGLYYTYGSSAQLGYVPSDPLLADPAPFPDQNLGWEHTKQTNLGIDFSFFKGRLTGSVDIYKTNTTDLLFSKAVNPVTGYTSIVTNIGATSGRGIDISLTSTNIHNKDFSWTSTLNMSAAREKIELLANGKENDLLNLWFIGERIRVFYDYQKAGIWQNTQQDLDEIAKYKANGQNFNPGDIKVVDQNGDYKIDAANDRVLRGHSQPNLVTGLTNDFSYKNWGVSIFMFSRMGYTIAAGAESLQGRFVQRELDYWTPTNPTNEYPSPNYNSAAGDAFRSSMNYQDGSFIKIRNITLSYSLPAVTAKKWHMQNLKVYLQALNPGLIYSKISWMDPDLNSGAFNRGLVLGVNANF